MNFSIKNISYTYEGSTLRAVDNVSASFKGGWTGLVGDNGSGKSTLLSIICGSITPDSGQIIPSVSGVYCAQSTEDPPHNMEDFSYDYSALALKLRTDLHIEDEWFWRFDTLSHGERKRIQITCALALGPDVLALDEPTNHLDSASKQILLRALKNYRYTGIIVSHDRDFLDEIVYQCIFMEDGKAQLIPGNYSQAKAQSELLQESKRTQRKAAREDLARIRQEAQRRKVEASRASARRSGKHLAKHDSDGRAKLRLAVYSGQDGKTALLSARMDKRIEAAQGQLNAVRVEKRYDKALDWATEKTPRRVIFRKEAGMLALGADRRLIYPDLYIGNNDRIALRGDNGAGKSSLLGLIMAELSPDDKIVYIPQEVSAQKRKALLADVKDLAQAELGQLLSIVARLNSPPERVLSGDELSPGELRKLMLAEGLLKKPYLIVMDEPTNHLDIHSIEALQAVLEAAQCALVLVSHDAQFLSPLTTIVWDFVPNSSGDSVDLNIVAT